MGKLPDFDYPTTRRLREIWRQYSDDQVRALVLEIVRLRRVVASADDYREVIAQVWREDVGGHLVALHQLRILLQAEKEKE